MGEVVAIVALLEAFSFILVDLGRPSRVLGVLLYASPTSLMFWDILALTSYFIVCSTILIIHLLRRYGQSQHWLRPIALTSVPLAFGIHIVTAMLYSGLVARVGWLTAVLAPKFLATALTSGAALLLLVSRYVENSGLLPIPYITRARLAAVMTYSLGASILLVCLESFTALYSGLPTAKEYQSHHFSLQDPGFASWMVFASVASIGAMIALLLRNRLQSRGLLEISSAAVLASVMIEKGIIFAPSGFVPSVVGSPTFYRPSLIEILIVLGIHSGGILVAAWLMRLTIFHRTHSDSPLVVTPMSDSTPSVGASGGPPFVTVSSSR
jgi:molybdopterin-containing oxidoreductase family membrane subunit